MKVLDIKESGCPNTLLWSISNGANIKEDMPLVSLINDELFYLVTLGDVNFFELFRLTQMYRDKLRIVNEKQAEIPTRSELEVCFPGEYKLDETRNDPIYELAEHVIDAFMNLTIQMTTDDDIIHSSAVRLFLPMISRKFDIQIPIAFIDMIDSVNKDEYEQLFSSEYPNTLKDIIDTESHSFKHALGMLFVKLTQILKYDQRYNQYLKVLKYSPLKAYQTSKLYKIGLLGFSKKDNISRTEIRCSLFQPNPNNIQTMMKRIGYLNTPLELDMIIQLPIQYMQVLENSFGTDILPIRYKSSMSSIVENGLIYEDFKTSEYVNSDDEEDQKLVEEHDNKINVYKVRMIEANEVLLKSIPLIMDNSNEIDSTSMFAMFPSIYMTNAMITVSAEHMQKFIGHSDSLISEMFQEISTMMSSVSEDIRKAKEK